MAETVYDVKVRYMTDDRASKGLRTIGQEAERASRSSGSLTKTLMGIGAGVAAWKGFSLGKSLLIDFNSQMEQSAITMGGLMMMNMGGDWASNQERANKLMAQFQEDAKSSVATTADFANVASGIVAPLTQVGGTMEDIRKITQGVVVASGAFGMSGEVAARDIEQALAGRMGVADRLPKLLGLDPDSWNKMIAKNPAKAIPELLKVLQQPAIKQMAAAQANTFAGQWSTLKDNMQIALGKVGLPLMKELGKEFAHVAAWMDKNPERINEVARSIAAALVKGFGAVKSAMSFLWDNRETILSLAKAFVAFKAVKFATGGIASLAGVLSSMGSAAGSATSAIGKFAGSLGQAAPGLAALYVGAKSVADSLTSGVYDRMKRREDRSFENKRARFMGNSQDNASKFSLSQLKSMEKLAKKRGFEDKTMLMRSETQGGMAGVARNITAVDQMMAKDMIETLLRNNGVTGGLAAAKNLNVGDVAKMQGVDVNSESMGKLVAAAREKGFTGGAEKMMQMTPGQLSLLLGDSMQEVWAGLPDTWQGDDFIETLRGVTVALDINHDAIGVLNKTIAERAAAFDFVNKTLDSTVAGMKPTGVKGDRSTNVTIRKIEVVSDDPDRFAMNLVGAFQDYNKSPTQAAGAINER